MLKQLLEECEKERKSIVEKTKIYNDLSFDEYMKRREKEVLAKEEIIKLLCGTEKMTPKTAEKVLDDTKELIISVAMKQPMKRETD